ncbi:MAG TPA: LamG domain-containing protein [Chitinophagaceae bacterium]|nr:LamG domain-containing protein [Chitinophagaceae bacterium]
MKKYFIKNALLLLMVCGVLFTSCYKKFDPKSYQPAFTVNGYTSSAEIGAGSLVGYWAFDGSYVDSVSNITGTNVGASFTGGFKGQALQGALNGYVLTEPSNGIKNLQSFTITEWVNTPPPSTGIIGFFTLANTTHFWGNIEMFFENGSDNSNGKIRIHVNKDGNDNTYSVDGVPNIFNTWTNIAVTYDASSSTFTLYINGNKVNSGTLSNLSGPLNFADVGNIVFGTTQFQTSPSQTSGATSQPWASFMTGKIDEVRVYNKVLTASDLQALIVLQGKGK